MSTESSPDPSSSSAQQTPAQLSSNDSMELFKFYEGAADKAKDRSWTLTTWVLALNAGLLAFSFDFFAKNAASPAFVVIEAASAAVGVALCGFLIYMLRENGGHVSHYWTSSNKIAAAEPKLRPFIGAKEADRALNKPNYKAPFPSYCRRLELLAAAFAVVHLAAGSLLIYHAS
jgi:hypothetical protein